MMKLLREFSTFEFDKEEAKQSKEKNGGKLILKGILQRADTLNQNGRVYPKDILFREIQNYQKLIEENRAFGSLDHEDSPIVTLETVSHVVRKTFIEGNVVYGEIEILPTPKGKIIEAIIEAGCVPGISSRGVGSVKSQGDKDIVQEDFQLICFDLVSEPSTVGAFMTSKTLEESALKNLLTRSDKISRAINDILLLKQKK